MLPFRDAVYEQVLTADEILLLYREVIAAAQRDLSGVSMYRELSRAAFFMGRAFEHEGRRQDARTHYEEGLRFAERAVAASPCADSWTLRAENLAFLIPTRSWAFAVTNGLDVERFAAAALALDPAMAAAQFVIAGRWIFAPRGFGNIPRGLREIEAILANDRMGRDDRFNAYSVKGWAFVQQRRYADAIPWLYKALGVFPTNRGARDLLAAAEAGAAGRRR